jgi:hypothetical protein
MKKILPFIIILAFVFIYSCSDDEDTDPASLKADAGFDQQVKPKELVTLDGSRSQGPSGFAYDWSYVGEVPESEIGLEGKNTSNPTFTPPRDGIYYFTLRVSSGGESDTDEVTVVATGAVEIGGILTEDLYLENLQSDESLPDYIVTSDLTVEDGIKIVFTEDNIRLSFSSLSGIHIKSGGTLTNLDETESNGFECELFGNDGWKGILVESGSIFLENAKIKNAGNSPYSGFDEAAAITLTGTTTQLNSLQNNEFVASGSYDILALSRLSGSGYVGGNQFSYTIPIKAPITFTGFFTFQNLNMYPESYDYVHYIPGGADKKDENSRQFNFFDKATYYIDGDFWAGNRINVDPDVTIYMKEGSGILCESFFYSKGFLGGEIVFDGLDGAQWKGIANISTSTGGDQLDILNTTIKNAGHGIIDIGGFTAEAPAALYVTNSGNMDDSKIIDSGGYGYYNESEDRQFFRFRRTLFQNTALPAIRTNMASVEYTIKLAHDNIFDLAEGLAAYLVVGDGSPSIWPGLGDDNFYLIDGNIQAENSISIDEGGYLKFKSGRAFIWDNENAEIYCRGRQGNPVILDGEAGTPGSWGGVYLAGRFRFEGTIIRNGGEFILPGATELANVISAIPSGASWYREMIYSTISDSAGYGIVVEQNTEDFGYDSPDKFNSFDNNASGDVLRK